GRDAERQRTGRGDKDASLHRGLFLSAHHADALRRDHEGDGTGGDGCPPRAGGGHPRHHPGHLRERGRVGSSSTERRKAMTESSSSTTAGELEVMRKLRAVLKRSSKGLGLAASFVGVFSEPRRSGERDATKRILLGTPVENALAGVISEESSSGELLRFIAALARIDSSEASKGAERLSSMFDRWTL